MAVAALTLTLSPLVLGLFYSANERLLQYAEPLAGAFAVAAGFAAVAPLVGFFLALAVRASTPKAAVPRRAKVMANISLLLSGVYFFMLLVPVSTGAPRERARRTACMSNLKQIGLGLRMYSSDHNELFPASLAELAPYVGSNSVSLFLCPSAGHRSGAMHDVDSWTDYTCVPGLSETNAPDTVIAMCSPDHHHGDGANVLFVDGHVEWMPADWFTSATNAFTRAKTIGYAKRTQQRQ